MLCRSGRYLVGSSFTNIWASWITGTDLGPSTKQGLDHLTATSGSALRRSIFWPIHSLTVWELRYSRGRQTSGTQPSTGHSRSATNSTTSTDWKCQDTVEMPVIRCITKATGLMIVNLATTTTTAWNSPRTIRIMINMLQETAPKVAMGVGGTTSVTCHV